MSPLVSTLGNHVYILVSSFFIKVWADPLLSCEVFPDVLQFPVNSLGMEQNLIGLKN